jgi:N-acetylglucosaminyl-diphospho-decaprenol L-rhamnosyltransferase
MVTDNNRLDLTIISVSYNSAKVFLASWENFLADIQLPVIIIDNGSPDGSGKVLGQAFGSHRVVSLQSNVGYGRAANTGFSLCRSRYALLLNPDLVITADLVSELYLTAVGDRGNTAIWSPALSKEDHRAGQPCPVNEVCGAAMLFDLQKMQRVGFFDENIFLYSEEIDLCYRTRQQGYLIKLCPAIYVDHTGGSSSGQDSRLLLMKSWHFGWSFCYYLNKHKLFSAKYNPKRMYRNYSLKSYLSLKATNRLRYRGQAEGVKAFLRGEKAFRSDGRAQKSLL